MRRSKNVGVALIGLLVVAAISMAVASGRKPQKEQQATVSLRRISASEVMDILRKFPEMVSGRIASVMNDTGRVKRLFPFSEVTSASLGRVFPGVRFYKGLDFGRLPENPYLIAIAGDKRYMMTGGFNRLLIDNGQKVTDENLVEMAKAFVVLAVGGEGHSYPEITFLDATSTKQVINGRSYSAKLRVKIGEQTEEWHFAISVWQGQFGTVYRRSAKGLIKDYLPVVVESLPGRGQLNLTPNMIIETHPVGDAYVEFDTLNQAYYYVIVERNSSSTGNRVVFSLAGFPPESSNVYVQIRDDIRCAVRYLHRVQMNSGSGSDTWTPPVESTGICLATAGYADTSNPGVTYQAITDDRELTPEKLKAGTFPGAASESLKVYFCDQFFMNDTSSGGESYAPTFSQYVDSAMRESWQRQVNTWGLDTPPDVDHIHRVFVNDEVNWYHALPVGPGVGPAAADSGANRQISITHNPKGWNDNYTNDDSLVRSIIAHEFYHGIQWGLSSSKWLDAEWRWFTEGQARFLQSAQCDSEEFKNTNHYYPLDANKYLTQHLNTSVVSLSIDTILKTYGYPYCLFWRYMFEHFRPVGIGDAVRFVGNCYAESVGPGSSVSEGKAAIDRAMAKYYQDHGTVAPTDFTDFLKALDHFAIACYLNDTSFHLWNPNPPGGYSRSDLTLDSTFRLGPNETDLFVKVDNVPCSYGIDLLQVVLDTNVNMLQADLTRPRGRTVNARLVKIYPAGSAIRYVVEPTVGATADSSAFWCRHLFDTQGAVRACLVITRQDVLDDTAGGYTARFWVKREVAVSDSLPITDTVIAGAEFTPRAVVANRGWMKEAFDATFSIEGTAYSSSVACTLDAGATKVVEFAPWTTTAGTFTTCCYVYIASDTTRSDDTLRGSLAALSNIWQARTDVPASVSHGGCLAAVGDTLIYAFRGGYSTHFFCYDVRNRSWTEKQQLPTSVGHGSSLTWDRGAYIYALGGSSAGGRHSRLFRYDIAGDGWHEMGGYPPGDFGGASALVWGGGGYLYAIQGLLPDNTQGFFRYDTAAEEWSLMQNVPKPCSLGASLCWNQAGYIYALCANKSRAFCRYNVGGSWSVKESTPSLVVHGAALAYNGLDDGIYVWSGATSPTHFWRYDADGGTWLARASPPADVGYGGALTGCAGYVYALRGNGNTDFWRYFPILESGKSLRAGVISELESTVEVSSFTVSPSPARGAVRLQWQVKEPGPVAVRVFDNTGRVARTIQSGYQAAGCYSARWDGICDNGRRAANGVFFYCLDAPDFRKIVKVVAVDK